MTIKGLTDRGLAFPEIGQIRKGGPKPNESQPGKDLQYFRVTFDEREVQATTTFLQHYGEQPTDIRIILPFNEIERMWDPYLEAYSAGRLIARADGEKYIYRVDVKTGQILVRNGEPFKAYNPTDVVGTWHNKKTGKDEPIKCRPTGRLKVIVPELGRAAYMTVMTTSIHDIANISAQLEAFKTLNAGQIAGIPFILRRRPKKISTPTADGGRARYTKWMLSIEADPEWVKAKLSEVKRLALPGNGLVLPEPSSLPEVEAEAEITDGQYVDEDDETEAEITGTDESSPTEQPPMTLEEAESMTTAKGTLYRDVPTDELRKAADALSRKERNADQEQKLLAMQIIVKARSEQAAAQKANNGELPK